MNLPARIGKYELEEFLGGGMSHVYRARDTVIGRTVAVKILTEAGSQDPEAKARFLAEARMAGNIEHDNVLSIYDFGEDDQHRPFMVMEFLRGEDLRHAIRDGHTGDLKNKLRTALQIARALEFIHTRKIVHRDIKPENIHITTAGVVKLMDFGIAKTEGLAMTKAGYVLGTPYYMAPEQVMGREVTEEVDVYAFGILLFELITGTRPISGDSVERIFFSILNEPLKLDAMYTAGAPQSLCDLVAWCTAKDPKDRLQGFAPVCKEIESIMAQMDAPTVLLPDNQAPEPQPAQPRRPAWLLPGVLALVVALGVGLYFATRPKAAAVVPLSSPPKKVELAKTITNSAGDMVLVEAGSFRQGQDQEEVSLPAFYIDKTKVTNRAYDTFCSQTGHPRPKGFPEDKPEYPVVNVTIDDAKAFCAANSKRLPTEPEWEKAARGPGGRKYPWGDEKDESRANVNAKSMRPVDAFLQGASYYGALDMIGNAWEWVDQKSKPEQAELDYYKTRVTPAPTPLDEWDAVRGLPFAQKLTDNATWDRGVVPAPYAMPMLSFRCAKDAQ